MTYHTGVDTFNAKLNRFFNDPSGNSYPYLKDYKPILGSGTINITGKLIRTTSILRIGYRCYLFKNATSGCTIT